jgi:transposase-like protein
MYKLEKENLHERQERAILLLVEGKTMSETAEDVGVNRSTIYRWKTEDALFMAEMNRLKESLWEAGGAVFWMPGFAGLMDYV